MASGKEIKGKIGSIKNTQKIGRHTSELQSHSDLVCRLLLEKKKKNIKRKKCKER